MPRNYTSRANHLKPKGFTNNTSRANQLKPKGFTNVNLLYFPDSIEITSVEGVTLCCPGISQSKQPLA